MNSKETIDQAHDDTTEFISKMLFHYEPLLIAACMITQGLSMYKTALTPEEFDMMASKIYQERHRIKPMDI